MTIAPADGFRLIVFR